MWLAAAREWKGLAITGEGAGGSNVIPMALESGTRLGADLLRLLSELGDMAAASDLRRSKAHGVCAVSVGGVGVLSMLRQRELVCAMCCLLRVAGAGVQEGEAVALDDQHA